MGYSRCAATAFVLCFIVVPVLAQEGTAFRTSLGTALAPAADGTARYREDTGWNSPNFSSSHGAVWYGTRLSTSPFIVVLQQPTRSNAALTANANQLTLDLAGGTYTVAPFLDDAGRVKGGKLIVADMLGDGAFLRIANGTLNNRFGTNSSIIIGDAGATGRMLVRNAVVKSYATRIGGSSAGAAGVLSLEAGGNFEVTSAFDVGTVADAQVMLSGANATLSAGRVNIGGATAIGVITLDDPTSVLRASNALGAGNLQIDNASPSVPGANAGLVVNAGIVLIDDDLLLASKFSGHYGAVEINGGRVAVGGTVVYGFDHTDTAGGKVFLNDGRFEVASPDAFRPNANQNFYWKNGTLAFTGTTTALSDAQLRTYTRQGASSYGGSRAEGTLAAGQTLEAAGTLSLAGGTIGLAGGTLRAGDGIVVNAPIAGYGTLDAVVSGTGSMTNTTTNELVVGGLNGANAIASAGDVKVGRSGIAGTYAGTSTGGGRFIKEGAATQTVSGSVLNSGGTDVSDGTLRFAGASSTLRTSSVNVADGAILRFEAGASGNAATVNVGATHAASVLGRLDVVGTGTTFAVTDDLVNNGVIELIDGSLNVGGTLVNHGQLINDGSLTGAVSGSGVLTGSGVFDGLVTIEAGAMLAPGDSPGTASFGDLTLDAGSSFELEIADATGTAGVDWDLAVVSGALSIAATSADPVTVLLKSLDASFSAGLLRNFDPTRAWSWKFLAARIADPASIDADAFRIDASDFVAWNETEGGKFSAVAAGDGLYVSFAPQPAAVPEPGSLCLLSTLGVAAAGVRRIRKRRRPSA